MYYATLRQKQGELRALKKLQEFGNDTLNFVPNIILNDATQENLDTIRKSYDNNVLLDVRDLESDDIEILEELLDESNNAGFDILYPVEYLLNRTHRKREYVRISKNNINPFFVQWLQTNKEELPDNIVIDFEHIESLEEDSIARSAQLLELLDNRNIIIMSGAVPSGLPVASDKNYEFDRIEKSLFNKLKEGAPGHSNVYFGDYSSVSPILVTGGFAIVQIKYTLNDKYWFVRNGQRRGNYDFVSVCHEIVNIDGFDEQYCWGDNYIKSVVQDDMNKGNPSVWTSIGINRHTVLCIDEFS